ncbi:DUF3445 domain-containing protein [Acidisphaera sp. L21]|uniref:heme-dependent oxidative N-demethylase family protein n=1 Tax=Acidisphaera sp. L21 TaxID=1641851 RepID=UPI0020B11B3B|nr:DUF3445 domain-containing protein [Acidisphaera sp. L21]
MPDDLPPLPPEHLYLPFSSGPFRMAMGLQGRDPDELLEIDERYPDEMAERRDLLATRHADVFAAEPGSGSARAEVLAIVASLLPRRYPSWFTRDGTTLHNDLTGEAWNVGHPAVDPLELAGRMVQEDLCIIDTAGPSPVLAAAILCAPSRWRLADKIGRPLADVHGPVPLYADRLSTAVDRFMNALRPGKLAERVNWSVVDDPALFQVGGKHRTGHDPSITIDNAAERLFLRVERQTLIRLPESGSVLFAIHVHSYPIARVTTVPGAAADLAAAIRALPEDFGRYKSIPVFRDALLGCLDVA